jgi:hypothetical protein
MATKSRSYGPGRPKVRRPGNRQVAAVITGPGVTIPTAIPVRKSAVDNQCPESAARSAARAVRQHRRPVAMTLAVAASTLAPHSARKLPVTLRNITEGRRACSQALFV